jgi:hypothetical protein
MATATKTRSTRSRTRSSSTQNGSSTRTAESNKRSADRTTDAAAERIRDLNGRILESSRKAGNVYVDIYEKTLNSVADYQEKVGEQSQVDWVTTMANAQADFTRQLTRAYTSAARSVLK